MKKLPILVLVLFFTMSSQCINVSARSDVENSNTAKNSIVVDSSDLYNYGIYMSELKLSYLDLAKINLYKANGLIRKTEAELRAEIIAVGKNNKNSVDLYEAETYETTALLMVVNDGGGGGGTTVDCSKYEIYGTNIELTDAEKELVLDHPFAAIEVAVAKSRAENYTVDYFGINGHNDKSDAYRHSIWNGLMVKAIDYSLTYDFATAHEDMPDECIVIIEKEMDLYNNMIGRIVANTLGKYTYTNWLGQTVTKFYSNDEIADIMYDELLDGGMKYILDGVLVYTDE